MINNSTDELIVRLYDETLRDAHGSLTYGEVRDNLLDAVVAELQAEPRDLDAEAKARIRRVLDPTRAARSNSFKKSLEYLLDGFTEDGVYVDPILDQAFPLGTSDGQDKTLRYWTREDYNNVAFTRYRGAAEAMESARELDQTISQIVERMGSAETTGDVDWARPQAA